MNAFEIVGIGAGLLIAAVIFAKYYAMGNAAIPTLDEVMASPSQWFRNSEWDPVVAMLVHDAAFERTTELDPRPQRFMQRVIEQEDAIWAILNEKLTQGK